MGLLPIFIALFSFGQIMAKSCPVGKNNVFSIGSGCYAFDKTSRTFYSAQQYCTTIFGSNQRGKIYEPRSQLQQNEVLSKWNEIYPDGYHHWLGISDVQSEGVWKYVSDNQEVTFNSWRKKKTGDEPDGGSRVNCAYQQQFSNGPNWYDLRCWSGSYTICELI